MSSRLDRPGACTGEGDGHCGSFAPGHNMHWIQARLLGESPWGWRDAVVRSVHGGRAVAAYVHENGSVSASHHVALDTLVSVGDPIRVHEGYAALATAGGLLLSVELAEGLGDVPDPDVPELWSHDLTGGVVDLSTGRGIALDQQADEP